MNSFILDLLYIRYQKARLNWKDSRRWSGKVEQNSPEPRVYYGVENLPLRNEFASGGIIKCQDLAKFFPNKVNNSSILYLVSSSLPLNAVELVKIAKKSGVRIVVNQNGVAYPAWHGPGWERTNLPLRSVLREADYVIYQSEFCKRMSDKFLCEISAPSSILYNPVDSDEFVPPPVSVQTRKVLIAGTHNHAYRVRVALETIALLRDRGVDLKLLIAGPLKWHRQQKRMDLEVDQWCRELEIDNVVDRVGPYCQTEAVNIFQQCDILIHVQYNDVCPRLLVESMSCGLPVVYSRSGGAPELVGAEAGIGVFVPDDFRSEHYPEPDSLAEAVKVVYSDLERYKAAARKRVVERFDVKNWIVQHRIIFSSVLG